MWEWVTGLSGIDALFFGCAALGGGLFLIRLLFMFIGLGGDHDIDHDVGGDAGGLDHDHDMGAGMLSVTGLTGFFMIFGLTGLAMRLDQEAGVTASIAVAFGAGIIAMWLVAQVLRGIYRLRSSGNIQVANAVGQDGRVYLTIPAGGRGQVEVAVQGRLKVLDAVGEHPVELKTNTHIRVVRVIEGGTLVVEKTQA